MLEAFRPPKKTASHRRESQQGDAEDEHCNTGQEPQSATEKERWRLTFDPDRNAAPNNPKRPASKAQKASYADGGNNAKQLVRDDECDKAEDANDLFKTVTRHWVYL
jgi:hypothetical protein